ncbi:MAG TPA: F0F1 ATP synthase subunit A, partial [Actinomycetota bacterium]
MTWGLLAEFVAPTTKDFVWPCWGGGLRILGFSFCLNFVIFLVLLSFAAFLLLFYLAFRKPQIVPSGLQNLMEVGILFVRDNIARPMIGPEGDRFMPLLSTLFFFIFL